MVLLSSISFLEFGFHLQVQTILTFLPLSLSWWAVVCYFSTKARRSKTSSWWKDKEKSKCLQIFLPFDVYEEALLHEINNGVFVVRKH